MSYTAAELDTVLSEDNYGDEWSGLRFLEEKWGNKAGDPVDGEDGWYYLGQEELPLYHPDFGDIRVEALWGGEGDGAAQGQVISVQDEDGFRYFERVGRYSSWDGDGDWSNLYEVEQFEKTVKRYRKI